MILAISHLVGFTCIATVLHKSMYNLYETVPHQGAAERLCIMVGDPAAFALAPCGNPILAQRSAPEAGNGKCYRVAMLLPCCFPSQQKVVSFFANFSEVAYGIS